MSISAFLAAVAGLGIVILGGALEFEYLRGVGLGVSLTSIVWNSCLLAKA